MNKFPYAIVFIMLVLVVWGVLGMLEYFVPSVELGLQNSQFPPGLQFIHFLSIILTGSIFLVGYFSKWSGTPFATIGMFAVLATICFIETVDFGAFGGPPKSYLIMGVEYLVYVGLSVYLLRAQVIRDHFSLRTNPVSH